MKEDLELEEI